jgi:hypothetical protein
LAELLAEHDQFGLALLSPAERQRQFDARAALYTYLGWLYTRRKAQGLDPKYDPELAVLGAYRLLAGALADAATEAVDGSGG